MSTNDLDRTRAALFRELSEASVLPPDDPVRQAAEDKVARGGTWMRETWFALLEEAEAWRLALSRVDAPVDLVARLVEIPRHDTPVRRMTSGVRRRPVVVSAAVLAVAAVLTAVLLLAGPFDHESRAVREVAILALNDHLDTHELEVRATEVGRLEAALSERLPFTVRLPALGPGLRLEGGRRCTLGTHPVAFTAWRGERGRVTLIQLESRDFGLPADMPPRVLRPDGQAARARPLDVFFFGEGDFVWVVVADAPEDLARIRRAQAERGED